MAIPFARAELIQRSRGHSTIERHAYITRTQAVSNRTGQTFDFAHHKDYLGGTMLLPTGAAPFDSAIELCNSLEMASTRKDAALGIELVLALPMPEEQSIELSQSMAEAFCRETIVEKHGLTAIIAVHTPHGSEQALEAEPRPISVGEEDAFATTMAMSSANLHVHALISPRQRTAHGWAKRRYTMLDPVNRNGKTYGRNWGRLWGHFQNAFFAAHGSELRVNPNPPVPLTTAPLRAVRGWRAKQRKADPGVDGRALLVNQTREHDNTDAALKIDGLLQSLKAPFTRTELQQFFLRHLPRSLALEASDAAIGLGECVELSTPGLAGEWYATVGLVHHELAALGRAIMLAERFLGQRDVSQHVIEGFTQSTSTVLADVFSGPDLLIVEAAHAAHVLAGDIARLAEKVGLRPVSIAIAAGHPAPPSILVEVPALSSKMISNAVIILDDPDALAAAELSLVLAAAVAGNNKLIVLRREDSDWPRLELVDVIAQHVPVLKWEPQHYPHARARIATKRSPNFPRTAIALAPRKRPEIEISEGWPRFGVDFDGEVITSMLSIAVVMRMLTTVPDDLDWVFANNKRKADEALLRLRLEAWSGEKLMMAPALADGLDAEHAAFDSLDMSFNQIDDDSFDAEPTWETEDNPNEDWPEEDLYGEPGLDEPEV